MLRLFIRLDRLRSNPWLFLAGDAPPGERCSPAFIAAAACREDKEGDLGDGGLGRKGSADDIEMRRGRLTFAEGEVGSELRSGGMVDAEATRVHGGIGECTTYCVHWQTKMGDVDAHQSRKSLLSCELQAAMGRADGKLVALFATSSNLTNDVKNPPTALCLFSHRITNGATIGTRERQVWYIDPYQRTVFGCLLKMTYP